MHELESWKCENAKQGSHQEQIQMQFLGLQLFLFSFSFLPDLNSLEKPST